MNHQTVDRLRSRSTLHTIQVEVQDGFDLSPIHAQVLARRGQQLVDEQTGLARQPGQLTYQAIARDEPPGKPLEECRKVTVRLTVMAYDDVQIWCDERPEGFRCVRTRRILYEASMQGRCPGREVRPFCNHSASVCQCPALWCNPGFQTIDRKGGYEPH